jgi:isoleucyl-tRNA synthetase
MHKSGGYAVSPYDFMASCGADVMRLWAAAADTSKDVRWSGEILERVMDAYRKFRNTLRYALGNLADFDPATDTLPANEMNEIDLWALANLDDVTAKVLAGYAAYDFQAAYLAIYNFCTVTLSARYFDIIKDTLYILAPRSRTRRSSQTALYRIAETLSRLLTPILAFTSDEAWENLPGQTVPSVHMAQFPEPVERDDAALMERWERIFSIRDEVLKALEAARNDKQIGSSLEAKVILTTDAATTRFLVDYYEQLRYIFIVSQVEVREGDAFAVEIKRADGEKCERCWNYSIHVGEFSKYPTVCERCNEALTEIFDV